MTKPFADLNHEPTNAAQRLLARVSPGVARVLAAELRGTGVVHACILFADDNRPGKGCELGLVADADLELLPKMLREFADQLEARVRGELDS